MATPLSILIIEDSEVDSGLLVRELKKAQFDPVSMRVETETAYHARLALNLDVIFSDFSVPGFSTRRALELLRETNLDIPFIIVSGMIGEEELVEALKAGATDYVPKDHIHRLGPVLRRALRETEERRERKQTEEALRESEQRFRQVTESIDEVFWRLLTFWWVNLAGFLLQAHRIFGLAAEGGPTRLLAPPLPIARCLLRRT